VSRAGAFLLGVLLAGGVGGRVAPASAQARGADERVLRAIVEEATARSRIEPLAQTLLDSLGPRLTGSPAMERAQDWVVRELRGWGVDARLEQYGTWEGWERGVGHVDLLAPRARSLEAALLAWSPGTGGRGVEAGVAYLPELAFRADWDRFLGTVSGKWVLLSFPQPTCRPDRQWAEYGMEESTRRVTQARLDAEQRWTQGFRAAAMASGGSGATPAPVHAAVERAGAVGIITSQWPGAPGTVRIMEAHNRSTPTFSLSCEDYGLVHRLAANGQSPRVRLEADARELGEVPVYNVLGQITGSELPGEYVILSAHLDSWDGASGATDDGAGVIEMLEAMRVLATVAPRPRRTVLIALWSGEEQGLNGSRAFVEDHPEIVEGLQALWNRDAGTGRVTLISAQGFVDVPGRLDAWLERIPVEVGSRVDVERPGMPSGGGSDYSSFVCMGAPGIPLGSLEWDHATHTWHSDRDTYDKLVFDDMRNNVVLVASLAYLSSEDPERVSRRRREMPSRGDRWPACGRAARSSNRSP
jgi:carboxypeptidase Q